MNVNSVEDDHNSSALDVIESPRKRMRLDTSARKSWSLMDRKTDTEVLQEMGVSLLEPDDGESNCDPTNNTTHRQLKRKRDIENVNPNISRVISPAGKSSPGPSRKSPRSCDKLPLQPSEHLLDATLGSAYLVDAETPLGQSVSAGYKRSGCAYSATSTGGKKLNDVPRPSEEPVSVSGAPASSRDTFSMLPDELVLSVLRWLPKRALAHCALVCKRLYRLACDETLWQRLDLGNKTLAKDALGRILARKPVVVRLASSEIGAWSPAAPPPSRVQYLDLSMCSLDSRTLEQALLACPALRKLSLESVALTAHAQRLLGRCASLETLNLTMAQGLTAEGLSCVLQGCAGLQSLNVSWCNLSEAALRVLVTQLPTKLQRLNVSGARLLTDDMVSALVARCPRLLDLDVSDCSRLGVASLTSLLSLTRLEHLALSRCYLLPPHSLMQLSGMTSLQYLEVWGMLQSGSLNTLRKALPAIQLNQFMFSAIARPTIGTRRTSIWGLRTRD
ncbi:S-phase kinase-associated protein 2-like [Vanessa cardui]|uniref:S-phase kinase-associated protein 2-like n=1 Tax=Vanessa cardui TaxID=171605 RepID=UPI001F13520A|nr:S-phase kinase-associated protein 2-like [Vanessa cardui]